MTDTVEDLDKEKPGSSAGRKSNPMDQLKERAAAVAAEKDRVMKEKMERVKAGMEEAKRKRRLEEQRAAAAAKKAKAADPLEGLYSGLPEPDPQKDQALQERRQEKANWAKHRFPALPPEDPAKVIFLDVDGVLRPLTAGGFRAMMVDGEWALRAETADFISGAMLSLRHVVENTGAMMVLSSEWRRDPPMREGVDNILREYNMPPCASWTPTDLTRDMGTENPFKAFTERRAREISQWLSNNPAVRQWVVLDDINMSTADEDRKPGTLLMTPRIVQTHRKIGLTLENAKAAVRILRGEKLPPQILEVQPHVELV
mmetsp:Transcript_59618/g.129076  ORF Transcript_59618/g.129076 Transcript_59618/m.129076 type:complete len:315 (-) Transcript_59618:84-1028(-)|eukprot:CAMPEP_0170583484 /NCGR_PEP_ID=MMETSP0224-20130122/8161_1 /TAXON_ID=285029 /ORGANISM="Togula jolla, Strain CCCM 725" /LENGTH=314 /DNA_ID=CAMNT_0010906817 /DNA_START=83 /DNA_END=1027 /DNA_ORIENTATION=-